MKNQDFTFSTTICELQILLYAMLLRDGELVRKIGTKSKANETFIMGLDYF